MTKETKDNTDKWSAPTSSNDDAIAIKRLVEKIKEQKENKPKDDDKTSS